MAAAILQAARSRYLRLIDGLTDAGRLARSAEDADTQDEANALLVSAPGRTELGGNHTDHNGGLVLAAAVDLDIAGIAVRMGGSIVAGVSSGHSFAVDLSSLDPEPRERGTPSSIVRGIAASLSARGYGIGGFLVSADSMVPVGSGLSSSAAFEVFIGTILSAFYNDGSIPPLEIALAGQEAENRFFGKPCGLMDQTASALGGAVFIDFSGTSGAASADSRGNLPRAESLAFSPERHGYSLCIVQTGGSHEVLTDMYAAIPEDMRAAARILGAQDLSGFTTDRIIQGGSAVRAGAGDRAFLRAIHFSEENRRVLAMRDAVENDRMEDFLRLVRESGRSSFMYLQNCVVPGSSRNQEIAVALSLTELFLEGRGACRVHGGGFAGTIQAYVPTGVLPGYIALMERFFGLSCVRVVSVRKAGTFVFG